MITFLRRRGLGRTSCNEMARMIREMGGQAQVVRNDNYQSIPHEGMVVRWGCTTNIYRPNVTVINDSSSIHLCNDKVESRMLLQDNGVPTPKTWGSFDEWINDVVGYGCFPVVVRPTSHSRGRNLLHTNHSSEVEQFLIRHGGGYISEYIPKVREVRVFVANGRAVWVAEKTPGNPDDVAWNVDQGGRFDNVKWSEWPMPAVSAAVAASNVIGTDFAGVDVMLDADNNPYVLELNSAPSQTSPYRQLCSAKAFKWMHDHREETLPVVTEGGWKEYIHPAIRS
jgi:glutathione synthase/RimK-type ligase-like ATP-grasp enzyme